MKNIRLLVATLIIASAGCTNSEVASVAVNSEHPFTEMKIDGNPDGPRLESTYLNGVLHGSMRWYDQDNLLAWERKL